MRAASTHIAFVVNEFGDFVGVLTMTDILESIAGELPDASEIEGPDVIEEQGGFMVNGALNLTRVRERTGFGAQPTEDYQTLAGLVMSLLDRLPMKGDRLQCEGWQMTVVAVEERRVTRCCWRLKPLNPWTHLSRAGLLPLWNTFHSGSEPARECNLSCATRSLMKSEAILARML
jgi:CBS domain containing-hemolysin-like protein